MINWLSYRSITKRSRSMSCLRVALVVLGFVLLSSNVSEARFNLFGRRSSSGADYRCKVCGKQHAIDGVLRPSNWKEWCHKCDKHDCGKHKNHTVGAWTPKNMDHWQNLDAAPAPVAVAEPVESKQPTSRGVERTARRSNSGPSHIPRRAFRFRR